MIEVTEKETSGSNDQIQPKGIRMSLRKGDQLRLRLLRREAGDRRSEVFSFRGKDFINKEEVLNA